MSNPVSDTLDAIRAALRAGDFAALADLTARLDSAVQDMTALPAEELHVLRQRAGDTATCLAAARNGIRAARRRVAEVTGGPAALSTYDRDGRRSQAQQAVAAPKRL